MQKIYCYVDGSEQDTFAQTGRKQVFVVAVVVLAQDKDEPVLALALMRGVSGDGFTSNISISSG